MRFLARYFGLLATLAAAAASCIFLAADQSARAQIARTIRIVVPYAPGGAADIVARLMADQAGRTGGVTMVVENRPGAGGAVGTETVARATPDGTTLLVVSTPFLIDPLLRKLNYDPLHSFAPICNLVSAPTLIVVNSVSPYRTLAELLDDARARPGQITMASIGPASSFQLGFEMLKRAAKVDMTFVPYPGNAPALSAVLGQQVTSMFATLPNVSEYLKAGKLRALAVGNRTRAEPLPDVPTVVESGYGDFDIDAWFGAFAPAATPEPAIKEVEHLFTAALQDTSVKEKLSVQGLFPTVACGNDFAAYLRKQNDEYSRIITEANIKAE
ncbi:MAG: Bug family tripartite tricarboxylate transporter substrate binding protein [Xanthobacteraceae bacterium]|jgi:tripartite-type tricarboxylate transporter receptor subunit TctC